MTIRVFDVPGLIEEACLGGLQRGLGLLCEAVDAEVDDAALAAVARYYVGAYNRWEQAKEWRGQVFPCRD
ncbi:hypothetical protein ELG83_10510 [Rhizobium leguminosarum]|uniref:hypothetical protein n=1 Tax=Rhizobium leguminosarum TaxID=384 RepID=UPI0010301CE3|nr:hypothetical protein [Rhizobium leguminosarum]TBF94522.1 hypothetical protein ELG83_10510 [Rhizobium leguminosarum]